MNRRELFKAGAVLAAAPAMPVQAPPQIPDDMREFIRLQGWTCIDEALPPEGELISMVRADGALGMFIGTARRHGNEYHCEHSETGAMLGLETAPHGWALYPAPIRIAAPEPSFHMHCSGEGVPFTVSALGGVCLATPNKKPGVGEWS
jgi:hypothetical protein